MAIAEAVKNAMDAIEDSGRPGQIEVGLERDTDLASQGGALAPVRSILIRDNGVGFHQANFESFSTPDSLYKVARGGKGLGRLICLQVFERVAVESVYARNGSWEKRVFVFQCDAPELAQLVEPTKEQNHRTEVRLIALRNEFGNSAAVHFDTLVEWMAEHFLPALVEKPQWLHSLIIRDGKNERDLTKLIEGGAIWSIGFKIKNYEFQSSCYAIRASDKPDQVRLVAGGRVVDANTRELEHYVPRLASIADEKPHVVLVRSSFFEEHVNDARNGVSFCEDGEEEALLGVTAAQFREGLAGALKERLGDRLSRADEELKKRIEELIHKEAPFYRPLLLGYFDSKEFAALNKSIRDEEILASLDAYKRREVGTLKRESKRLARLQTETADYVESARKLADLIETQKKVALAEYVTLRKIVLDRLEQLLETKDDSRAHPEEAIHDLIFPQRTNSESSPGAEHQLWIVDERLESHTYLASDSPMDGKKGDRPDLLIALDRPGAFANDPSPRAKGYERIVLVEFKRALNDLTNVATDELPHRQMMRYALQITEGKALHLGSGRPITVSADARFYLYSMCELSSSMLKRLDRDEGFTLSPTGDGAFAVKNNGRYYVEYLSLPKVLEDAKARNQAFFRRLGLEA